MQLRPDHSDCLYHFAHWSYVAAGAPWQHTSEWLPPTEPTPTELDRITALERKVAEHVVVNPEALTALERRIVVLEQLFWAHSHETEPVSMSSVSVPRDITPEGQP